MKVLLELMESAAASDSPPGSIKQLVGSFWQAAMDAAAIEAAGAAPLHDLLAIADALADGCALADGGCALAEGLAKLHAQGVPAFFALGDAPDAKDSNWSIAQVKPRLKHRNE